MSGFFAKAESLAEKLSDLLGSSIALAGFRISAGGALAAAGFILGMILIILEAKRRKDNPDIYVGALLLALLGGLFGARAYAALLSGE